jgi:hypothetical protein
MDKYENTNIILQIQLILKMTRNKITFHI